MQAQSNTISKRNSIIAAVCTLFFHAGLILLLYFCLIYTHIPPFPEGGGGGGLGIEVNLGNSEFGLGDIQENITMPDFSAPSKSKSSNENVLTQDNESTTSINHNENNKQNAEANINQNAIYKGNKSGNNQGVKGGQGDQGDKNGNPNSNNYYKGGAGSGGGTGGGDGTGNGPGKGPGTGPGSGPGKNAIHYDLKGRTFKSLEKPAYNSKEEGTVVVTIWVDKQGNVTKATAGTRGTTTTDKTLWKAAELAALKSKCHIKADAPEQQTGTITYIFITN